MFAFDEILVHYVHVEIAVLFVAGGPFQVVFFVPHRLCAVGHDGRVHAPVQPKPRRDKAVGARLSKPFFHQSPGADNAHADLVNIVMPPGLNHWCGDVELLARGAREGRCMMLGGWGGSR